LFFQEFVPAGTAFRVEISGQNLERGDDDLLLAVLEGFHDAYEPIRLGGGSADHRGRATWKLEELRTLDAAGLQEWLQAKPRAGSVPSAAVPQPDPAKQQAAAKQRIETLTRSSPRLVLAVELRFDGPFLVNDPSRYRRQAKKADAKQPDHSPRLTRDGKPLLPASALRGAVRSQAERIARTLNAQAIGDPHRAPADRPEDHVAPLERAFGYSGQVAAIEFTDFVGTEVAPRPLPLQQFVAIDRFTGGAAHEKLFNAEYVWMPVLEGKIYVALDERVPPWMLGLLALTMRDLIEGDITLGFGAAKGYGACRAAIRIPDCKLAGVERLPHDHAYGKLLAGIPADQERAAWLMKPEGYETVLRMCLEQLAENIPALAKSQKVTP
jgi:CRISPR/Cas system CSM-associated protein Csm3 (group 7 of RAMP superfamily)